MTKTVQLDQYNEPVPDDLALLDSQWLSFLSRSELWAINQLNWYETKIAHGLIFVSSNELEKCISGLIDFHSPEDMGLTYWENPTWLKIDQVLHRWNQIDGFYHA